MNKDEIKKGLTVCAGDSCDNCSYYKFHNCYDRLKLDACELIIEQEKEIARLKAENEQLKAKLEARLTCDFVDARQNYAVQDLAEREVKKACKETAKEIMQCLYDKCYEIQNLRECVAHITPLDILQLAKHYGVEVEE